MKLQVIDKPPDHCWVITCEDDDEAFELLCNQIAARGWQHGWPRDELERRTLTVVRQAKNNADKLDAIKDDFIRLMLSERVRLGIRTKGEDAEDEKES